MAFCSFVEGAAMFDATPIENLFLIEHLYDAPTPALKVYLYARMLALHPELGSGMAEIARALRLDEGDVYEAFAYWEKRELVKRLSDQPPTYAFLSLRSQAQSGGAPSLEREISANRDFNNGLQKLFGEFLIGTHELNKASDWVNILHLERDAVIRLVEYGIQTSQKKNPKPPSVFKRMDKLAEAWSAKGARTLEDVERMISEETGEAALAKEVLKALGISRQPSEPELQAVRRWTREWGYSRDQILEACGETLKSRNPSFGYLDSVLQNRLSEDGEARRALIQVLRELRPGDAQPSPEDVRRYAALMESGFSPELIQLAAVQCHQKNRHSLDDLEWRLSLWREEGLTTAAEADAYTRQMAAYARQLRALFKRAGYPDRSPGYRDIKLYQRWQDESPEPLIEFAAECARSAGGSTAYMDALLTAWRADGLQTVEAARAQHEARRASTAAQSGVAPANPALNYEQRAYRDEDFGEDFYFDYDREFGNEGSNA